MRGNPGQRPHWTRLALLATTVTLAAALLATGLGAWRGSRLAADAVVRAQAFGLGLSLRRELWRSGAPEEALDDLLHDLGDDGVTFLALVDERGALATSAGESSLSASDLARWLRHAEPWVPERAGDRVLILEAPPGPGAPRFGAPPGRRWRPGRRAEGPPGMALVMEFEPVLARALVRRATTTLVTSVLSAAVLLGAALMLWRASARADRAATELLRERHLSTLGEMSAVLGHEIRNPLASLKGNAQLLLERLSEDHRARPSAERVVAEAIRLERLTNQVLAFARSGALERRPVDPLLPARAAVEQAGDGRADLAAPPDLPEWPLDRERMEQVLVNVIRNAVEATPDPDRIDVGTRVEGDMLVYEVRDRGPGLEPSDLDRIFEPFYTRRVHGTGLGLALARRIVEGHGGTIEACNHAGGGALFRVRLPKEG